MDFGRIIELAVTLLTGTGAFLIGVNLLTSAIEQLATTRIKKLFGKTADKKLVNVGIGALTTAIIQSSGVSTVLIVGFVNVGLMNLSQATAMIMGANIGTTITAQIATLSAFPITKYIQALAFVGIMMSMICRKDKLKKTGLLLAGLGLVFIGLSLMSKSMQADQPVIQEFLSGITNPFLLFLIGIFTTALVQSSSATTSIIISMTVAGLTIGTGGNEVLYFILGTNIGSCVTAVMSSIGAGPNAKRAGLIHLMFNVFGSLIFYVFLQCYPSFMADTFQRWFETPAMQIAMFHTAFNLTCTVIFLPFSNVFVKVSQLLIKDKKSEVLVSHLDERVISSPSIAIGQIEKELILLFDTAMDAFLSAYAAFDQKNIDDLGRVSEKVESTSLISQRLINYMIKLSSQGCSLAEEKMLNNIHNNVGDVMRIAEIADNFTKYTRRKADKNIEFSPQVKTDLDEMISFVDQLYRMTKQAITNNDKSLLPEIERIEDNIDAYRKKLIEGHIERLNQGLCLPESNSIFVNLVSNIERLGDHITFIAQTLNPAK